MESEEESNVCNLSLVVMERLSPGHKGVTLELHQDSSF
uniref:Uncharacterized protein n=1 Tax=Rhizophora mucronata TaxID=61149 RepID=A0A2P2N9I3_RHIMU